MANIIDNWVNRLWGLINNFCIFYLMKIVLIMVFQVVYRKI